MDNIDRDLFGRAVRGAMYQPSDEAAHDMRMAAHDLMHSAYQDNLVRSWPCFIIRRCRLIVSTHAMCKAVPHQAAA